MEIGIKIKELRLKNGLTQEELADRCELTKGYISQLENDLTSPSIATLKDILISLGSSLSDFFSEREDEQISYDENDYFEKSTDGVSVKWLVPTSQKNEMEPILTTIEKGASTERDVPHEGEEFGYVIKGKVQVEVGKKSVTVKKGGSFYYATDKMHSIKNVGDEQAVVLWVSCPPNF